MKQKLLNKLWLRVGMIVAIMTTALSGTAWAQTAVVGTELWLEPFGGSPSSSTAFSETTTWSNYLNPTTFVASDASSLSYTSSKAMANSGTAANMTGAHVWLNKSVDGYIQVSGIKLYNSTKVKVSWAQATNGSSTTVYYQFDGTGDFQSLSTCSGPNANFESSELSVANHTTIALKFFHPKSNAKNTRIDNLKLTATEVASSGPSISASDVNIAFNADNGSIAYTLSNATGNVTASVEGDWLTLGTITSSAVPFTCSENPGKTARTATVTLSYPDAPNKVVHVTQAGNPNVVDNISDITAAGTYTVKGTIVAKSQRGFIVGDGTGYVYYYNQNYTQSNYNIGDKVKLDGSVVVYGGVFEFNNSTTVTAATESNYVAEEPTVLTGSQMDTRVGSTTPAELSTYVQYEGVLTISDTHYNITSIDGALTAKGSISYPISTDFTSLSGKTVKVTGYYVGVSSSQYYNTMLGSIEVVNTDPVISASDVNIAYDATSGEIAYTIANQTGATLTATTSADWISNIVVSSDKVSFTATANEGNADRTATITLSYTGAQDKVVTVTQGHYVADYATLPFEWEGGVLSGLSSLSGISYSLNDAGSYADNNAPYRIKLTKTGDYIQIKTDSRPGKVTIGVKMIGGATTSTITVQESADGETFDDVQELTISGAQNAVLTLETTNSFATDSRYVRLLFTKGSNVGVGPISIAEYSNAPVLAVTPAVTNVESGAVNGTLNVKATNFSLNDAEHDEFQYFEYDGSEYTSSSKPAWLTVSYNGTEGKISYSVTANDGEARSAYFKLVLTYDEEDIYSDIITINQAAYVAPFEAEDGVFDFVEAAAASYDYGSGVGTSESYIYDDKTWTAGNVTLVTSGRYRWWPNDKTLRFYGEDENSTKASAMVISVPNGKLITSIGITGGTNFSADCGTYESGSWTGLSQSVTLTYAATSGSVNVKTVTVTYIDAYKPTTISLNGSGYATFASTSAVDLDETADCTAWAITAIEGTSITFTQVEGVVAAGTGLLLKGAAGTTIYPEYSTNAGSPVTGNLLEAIVTPTDIVADQYYGLSGKTFVKVSAGTVPAGKALLPASALSNNVKAFTFIFDDEATGISLMEDGRSQMEDGAIYNIAGQRLDNSQFTIHNSQLKRGIYIVNGKKILK